MVSLAMSSRICDPRHAVLSGDRVSGAIARRLGGFTLIELMIVLAIMGILLMMVGPNMRDVVLNGRMGSQANEVAGMFLFARAESARLGRSVRVSPLPASPTAGNVWGEGWEVEAQFDGINWLFVRQFRSLHENSTLVSPSGVSSFTFRPGGRFEMDGNLYPDDSGARLPEVHLCDNRAGETGRIVRLNFSGQAMVKPVLDANGNAITVNNPC